MKLTVAIVQMHRGDFPPPHGPFRDDMFRPESDHSDSMDPKKQRALRSVFSKNQCLVRTNVSITICCSVDKCTLMCILISAH